MLPFGTGLVFSLLGDIFLLLNHRWFRVGLAFFMCAHVSYIIAFNLSLPVLSMTFYVLGLTVISVGLMIYTYLYMAMQQSKLHKRMILPVGIYSIVIAMMFFSSLLTLFRPDWLLAAAVMAAVGGFLFFVSDTMLAFDRFVRPFRHARFWIRVSYHLGQLLLAAGALQYGLV